MTDLNLAKAKKMGTRITPCNNYIVVEPRNMDETAGGIALPTQSTSEHGHRRGYIFAFSAHALQHMRETLGDKADRFHAGAEIEYFGHSVLKVEGQEFHIIKPVDIWVIIGETDE